MSHLNKKYEDRGVRSVRPAEILNNPLYQRLRATMPTDIDGTIKWPYVLEKSRRDAYLLKWHGWCEKTPRRDWPEWCEDEVTYNPQWFDLRMVPR